MKLTKFKLKQIIKEELQSALYEEEQGLPQPERYDAIGRFSQDSGPELARHEDHAPIAKEAYGIFNRLEQAADDIQDLRDKMLNKLNELHREYTSTSEFRRDENAGRQWQYEVGYHDLERAIEDLDEVLSVNFKFFKDHADLGASPKFSFGRHNNY